MCEEPMLANWLQLGTYAGEKPGNLDSLDRHVGYSAKRPAAVGRKVGEWM